MDVKLNGEFSDNCVLIRNSHKQYIKNAKPLPAAFSPDGGMSTDWDKYTTPEESLARIGLTTKINGELKNTDFFNLFGLKVGDIKMIEGVNSIDFTPIFHNPKIYGKPNNPSHSDVHYVDVELRLKFSEIAFPINVDRSAVSLIISQS